MEQKGISVEKTLPVSWLDEKLSLLLPRPGREPTTSRTPRLHNKQKVPRPTRSAIGRRIKDLIDLRIKDLIDEANINIETIRQATIPESPPWQLESPLIIYGLKTVKKVDTNPRTFQRRPR